MDVQTLVIVGIVAIVCFFLGRLVAELSFKRRETAIREDATKRSRAVIGGRFSEQLAPYLPDFPYAPTEVKFLGQPVDFVAFEGLDDRNVRKVTFVEVKSGKSSLTTTERSLKDTITGGRVEFAVYRVPDEVTRA